MIRPRMVVYASLLLIGVGFLVYSLLTRTPLILDVIRDRNALFREVHGDRIENAYSLKVINLDDHPHRYRLEVTGMNELAIVAPTQLIEAPPGSVSTVSARLEAPEALAAGIHRIALRLTAVDAPRIAVSENTRFIGPQP